MLSDSPRYEPPRLRSEPDPHDRSHAEQLWRAWSEHGDLAARNRLILSYVGMVKHLAHRKARELPAHYEVEDLVSAGLEALIAAVDRYDPAKGGFESYAWTRVSGALIDELRRADWAPRSLRRSARELEKAEDELRRRNGATATDGELSELLGVPLLQIQEIRADIHATAIGSLDASLDAAEEHVAVVDTIASERADAEPGRGLLVEERRRAVRASIASLPPRHQQVLQMAYVEQMKGDEIGKAIGVTASRVSQLLKDCHNKLRSTLNSPDELLEAL